MSFTFFGMQGVDELKKAILDNNLVEVENILKKSPFNQLLLVNTPYSDNKLPIELALNNGHHKMAQLLVRFGADINKLSQTDYFKKTQEEFTKALVDGNLSVLKTMMDNPVVSKMIINSPDSNNILPLELALEKEQFDIANLLIESGADINKSLGFRNTLLCKLAASKNHLKIFNFLASKKVDFNARNSLGQTPIFIAAETGNVELAKFLVQQAAALDVTDEQGTNLLMVAISNNDEAFIKFLIANKLDINALNSPSSSPSSGILGYASTSPLVFALEGSHIKGAKVLMEHGAILDASKIKNYNFLHSIVRSGDLENIEFFNQFFSKASAKLNFNEIDLVGRTPILTAIETNDVAMTNFLIRQGASVTVTDNLGTDPLKMAIDRDNKEIIKLLLSRKIDINARNAQGLTPLIYAIKNKKTESVKVLLDNGAVLDVTDFEKHHLPHNLVASNNMNLLQTIIDKNSTESVKLNFNSQDSFGVTPIFYAAENNNVKMAELLVQQGAILDKYAAELFTIAISRGHENFVKFLIANKQDVNVENSRKMTPLMYAIENKNLQMAKLLVENGAKLNIPELEKKFFLHDIVKSISPTSYGVLAQQLRSSQPQTITTQTSSAIEIIKLMIANGYNIDQQNVDGETALFLATETGNMELVEYLLSQGANPNIPSNEGFSSIGVARAYGMDEIFSKLLHPTLTTAEKKEDIDKRMDQNEKLKKTLTRVSVIKEFGHVLGIKTTFPVEGISLPMSTEGNMAYSSVNILHTLLQEYVARTFSNLKQGEQKEASEKMEATVSVDTASNTPQTDATLDLNDKHDAVSLITKSTNTKDRERFMVIEDAFSELDDILTLKKSLKNGADRLEARYYSGKLTGLNSIFENHSVTTFIYKDYLIYSNRGYGKDPDSGVRIYKLKKDAEGNPVKITADWFSRLQRRGNAKTFQFVIENTLSEVVDLKNPVKKLASTAQKYGTCSFVNAKSSIEGILWVFENEERGMSAQTDNKSIHETEQYALEKYKHFSSAIRDLKVNHLIRHVRDAYKRNDKEELNFYQKLATEILAQHGGFASTKKILRQPEKAKQELFRARVILECFDDGTRANIIGTLESRNIHLLLPAVQNSDQKLIPLLFNSNRLNGKSIIAVLSSAREKEVETLMKSLAENEKILHEVLQAALNDNNVPVIKLIVKANKINTTKAIIDFIIKTISQSQSFHGGFLNFVAMDQITDILSALDHKTREEVVHQLSLTPANLLNYALMTSNKKLLHIIADASGLLPNITFKAGTQLVSSKTTRDLILEYFSENNIALFKALETAVDSNNLWLVEFLLELDDVDPPKDPSRLIALLSKVNNINYESSLKIIDGDSPLHRAVKNRLDHIAMYLIKQKMDPYELNADGMSALTLAAQDNNETFIQYCIDNNLDIFKKDGRGRTALEEAMRKGDINLITIILKKYPDLIAKVMTSPHLRKENLLTFAARKGGMGRELLELSSREKIALDTPDSHGKTAFMIAVEKGDVETVEFLLKSGQVNVNQSFQHIPFKGDNALAVAFLLPSVNYRIVNLLINNKIDINAKNSEGDTPLMKVAVRGKQVDLTFLMDRGADPKLTNNKGKTAQDLAASRGGVFIQAFNAHQGKTTAFGSTIKISREQNQDAGVSFDIKPTSPKPSAPKQ